MTRYIGCETARELLDAFVDGELPVADQVMVEAHLRWCQTCRAHVEDLALIGGAVRLGSPSVQANAGDERALAAMQDAVLGRIGAEREQSFAVRVRELFADMHLLWPALGASFAVFVCLCGVFTVLQMTSDEHPDSLAAMIATMSDPGSEQNPLRLDNTVVIPRGLDDGPMLDVSDEEAVFAFATTVSRDGRIANYELLRSQRDVSPAQRDRTRHDREVAVLFDAVKQSRFEPAQALTGRGRSVAVNMVWLIARTTVKGSAREADVVTAAPVPVPPRKREAAKPPVPESNGVVSATDSVLTTA